MTDWRGLIVDEDQGLSAIFREAKTVAVLGAKADSSEPAYYVPAYLHARGYRIRPVNPRFAGRRLHEIETVASLRDLTEPVDVIGIVAATDPGAAATAVSVGYASLQTQQRRWIFQATPTRSWRCRGAPRLSGSSSASATMPPPRSSPGPASAWFRIAA